MKTQLFASLHAGAAPLALALAAVSAPAYAQAVDCATDPDDPACAGSGTIVVTGSILRRTDTDTPSPVTTITTESLDQRAISTIQDSLQSLSSNNGPALTNSFSANGAFAAGASAVSLRGLSTNSTLVLFDGLRAAYYPLADDGTRNFVDLNTIPDDIVERIEIVRDGASSAYGADAIAGVVNIITKREFKGISARAEFGISERGDAGQHRLSVTAGVGDIEENGYNAYLSGFYYQSDLLKNSQRPYPYNTDDLRNVCSPDGHCGPDNRVSAPELAPLGGFLPSTASNLMVAPYNATNTTRLGRFQNLTLGGCQDGLEPYTLTAAEFAANPASPATVCVVDFARRYFVITPNIERWGVSGRVTAKLSDAIEAYAEINFMQSKVDYTGNPAVIRGTANTGINFPQFSTSTAAGAVAPGSFVLTLPVFVCPNGVGDPSALNTGCNAGNGTLNPNNPFAAQGQLARLIGRIHSRTTYNETRTRAYRGALGISGDINDNLSFNIGATAMHVDLRRTQNGYVYIQNLLNAIARGSFNFVNLSANSDAAWQQLMPDNVKPASSDQLQLDAVLQTKLGELQGGPIQLAVGGSIRYEAVDAPSSNDDFGGPTQRYFTLNAFGTKGNRTIYSAYGEIEAPVLEQLTITAAGRYDNYSSGQSAFSPKVGIKVTPVPSLIVRGTFSRGFRIPSFGEANALPTTGFVTNTAAVFNNTYLAQYNCTQATFSSCPAYIRAGSYGQTTLASPNLKPERSTSFTASVTYEPIRNITLSVDYYNIKKTGVITQPSNAPALFAYYANQPIPAGYTVIADAPDLNFPNARPRIAFVASQLVNANTLRTSGIDFAIDSRFDITDNIRWTSRLEASYILKLETEFQDGTVERYDGTLGNFNLTAGSGTPKWHGYWLNSFRLNDKYELNLIANYFGGYDLSATDQGTGYKDCGLDSGYSPTGCGIPRYITVDLNVRVDVAENFTLSASVQNLLDDLPPIDTVTYGAHLYNPVQGGNGILGRYFKIGVQAKF